MLCYAVMLVWELDFLFILLTRNFILSASTYVFLLIFAIFIKDYMHES